MWICWRMLYDRFFILFFCSKDYLFLEYFFLWVDDIGCEVYIFKLIWDMNYVVVILNISLNIYDFSDLVICLWFIISVLRFIFLKSFFF